MLVGESIRAPRPRSWCLFMGLRRHRFPRRGPIRTARAMPALGRNIVVRPGQPVPEGWDPAQRHLVEPADVKSPTELIARLRRMADDRTACVFEVDDSIDAMLDQPQTNQSEIHEVGARFTFELSALRHLLWSNSVDGRDPDHLTWQPTEAAIGLGATVAPVSALGDILASRRHAGVDRRWSRPVLGAGRGHRRRASSRGRARFADAVRIQPFELPIWPVISSMR